MSDINSFLIQLAAQTAPNPSNLSNVVDHVCNLFHLPVSIPYNTTDLHSYNSYSRLRYIKPYRYLRGDLVSVIAEINPNIEPISKWSTYNTLYPINPLTELSDNAVLIQINEILTPLTNNTPESLTSKSASETSSLDQDLTERLQSCTIKLIAILRHFVFEWFVDGHFQSLNSLASLLEFETCAHRVWPDYTMDSNKPRTFREFTYYLYHCDNIRSIRNFRLRYLVEFKFHTLSSIIKNPVQFNNLLRLLGDDFNLSYNSMTLTPIEHHLNFIENHFSTNLKYRRFIYSNVDDHKQILASLNNFIKCCRA